MNKESIPPQQLHIPVLRDHVVELLTPQKGERYLDLTAGYGGHASAILPRIGDASSMTLVDRDKNAIAELQGFAAQGSRLIHRDFASAAETFVSNQEQFDMVLVDLGVSSPQLDKAERGFSLKRSGPLDMRMDDRQQHTAGDIVNAMQPADLKRLIMQYGEEPSRQAERIVTAIVNARPLQTTTDLADVIASTHRGPYQKVHPATRTFQAIRIALNDELGQLSRLLHLIPELLAPGGRIAIISFHSLEDRMVKRYFTEQGSAGYEAELLPLTTRAIKGATEDVHNPRARSAMLRAAVKTKK